MQIVCRFRYNPDTSSHSADLARIELFIPAMHRFTGKTFTETKHTPVYILQIDWLTAFIRHHDDIALQTKSTTFHTTLHPSTNVLASTLKKLLTLIVD